MSKRILVVCGRLGVSSDCHHQQVTLGCELLGVWIIKYRPRHLAIVQPSLLYHPASWNENWAYYTDYITSSTFLPRNNQKYK